MTRSPRQVSFTIDRFTRLKFDLLARGARVSSRAAQLLHENSKPALRVRSGSCGGIDLILPDGTHVNCPVYESFAQNSDLEIAVDGGQFVIRNRSDVIAVDPVPIPAYYTKVDSRGHPFIRTAQVCFDRLGVGITNNCVYWRKPSTRCQFCSIGLNTRTEDVRKLLEPIREAAAAALSDPVYPVAHTLVGGGTSSDPDNGIAEIAAVARALKEISDFSVYVMITPPKDLGLLELLKEAGVDEVGINMELFDESLARRYLQAKRSDHGLEGYLSSLARAVELFGPVSTRSILIVGLEPLSATLSGVEMLASMGVMPILSPFRPLAGTGLAHHPPPDAGLLCEAAVAGSEIAGRYCLPLGPTCLACQGNTLNIPGDPRYRWYGSPPIGSTNDNTAH
jgi:hypothetical protein